MHKLWISSFPIDGEGNPRTTKKDGTDFYDLCLSKIRNVETAAADEHPVLTRITALQDDGTERIYHLPHSLNDLIEGYVGDKAVIGEFLRALHDKQPITPELKLAALGEETAYVTALSAPPPRIAMAFATAGSIFSRCVESIRMPKRQQKPRPFGAGFVVPSADE